MRLLWVMLSDNRSTRQRSHAHQYDLATRETTSGLEAQERKVKVHKLINDKMGLRYRDVCVQSTLCVTLQTVAGCCHDGFKS